MYDVTGRDSADEPDAELRGRQRFGNGRRRERDEHHRHVHDEQLHDRRPDHRSGRLRAAAATQQRARRWTCSARATSFTFPALLPSGTPYVVERDAQSEQSGAGLHVAPRPASASCSSANVTNVAVTCTTRSFSIGGTVSGLRGKGLVLRKNDGDDRSDRLQRQLHLRQAGERHPVRGEGEQAAARSVADLHDRERRRHGRQTATCATSTSPARPTRSRSAAP